MVTCFEYAMNYLYRYPKTKRDLQIKLYQKGYGTDEVARAITVLESKHYIDDAQFTELYLNSEVSKKGKPLFMVVQKLREKGVDPKVIAETIHRLGDDIQGGMDSKIRSEISKLKKKGEAGFDIIQRLVKKWYKMNDITRVIKASAE